MTVTVEWPKHLKPMTNAREHPMGRHDRVKKEREAMRWQLKMNRVDQLLGPVPDGHRLLVGFTRIAPRAVDPGDNLNSCFKAYRDEVAEFFGVNDGDEDRIRFEYRQEQGPPKTSIVRVTFGTEAHAPAKGAAIREVKQFATTPREWARLGRLKSGVIRFDK